MSLLVHAVSSPRAIRTSLFAATLALFSALPSPVTATAQDVHALPIAVAATILPQPALPDAPSAVLASATSATDAANTAPDADIDPNAQASTSTDKTLQNPDQRQPDTSTDHKRTFGNTGEVDANGNPIPLNRQQPQRILGFMPNFRSVSGGAVAHPPGWKYNFTVATHQAFDYSSFIFLGLTTISAEGINSHPVLGKGADGFYAYLWRGFLDKTDGNYLGGWFLPSLLHEDTRYYAMGNRRSVPIRILYVMTRQVVTRTYGEKQTPNISGLGGKVLTQVISRTYYPTGATSFGVLATKFAYSAMRDMAFTGIREFYPDIAAHYVRKHREKAARLAGRDVNSAAPPKVTPAPAGTTTANPVQ